MNTTVTLRLTSSLTKTVHFNIEAFLESASLTLVSSLFIHHTVSISFTGIYHVSPHASHEKSTATIARIHSIMPSGRNIPANFTKYLRLSFQRRFKFLRRRGFSVHFLVFWAINRQHKMKVKPNIIRLWSLEVLNSHRIGSDNCNQCKKRSVRWIILFPGYRFWNLDCMRIKKKKKKRNWVVLLQKH